MTVVLYLFWLLLADRLNGLHNGGSMAANGEEERMARRAPILKDALVQIMVARRERDRWTDAAMRLGMTVSELVRESVRRRIESLKFEANDPMST